MARKYSQNVMKNLANALARSNPREIARRAAPAARLYGPNGPAGGAPQLPAQTSGPPMLPAQPAAAQRETLTPTEVRKLENMFSRSKGVAIITALKSAGMIGGRPRAPDRGATSPLGGQAMPAAVMRGQ
jgi:hypothetical protein